MSESDPCCATCKFYKDGQCRRRAPMPSSYLKFHELDLLRDIAWSLRRLARWTNEADQFDAIAKEAAEATSLADWPDVEGDDWCGEHIPKDDPA